MRAPTPLLAATILIAAPLAGAVLPTTPAQVQTSDEAVDAVDDTVDAVDDAAPGPSVPLSQHVQAHPPIRIEGNEGPQGIVVGHANGQPIYRAGSGVMVGSGTASDPYVISGWDLSPRNVHRNGEDGDFLGENCLSPMARFPFPASAMRWHAIEIKNTDAHIVIRDNRILPEDLTPATEDVGIDSANMIGILLKNADNVRIEGNQIGDMDGERLYRGICAQDSGNLEIANNQVENTANDGLAVEDANGLTISGNTFLGTGSNNGAESVTVLRADNLRIDHNTMKNGSGTGVSSAPDALIEHNTIVNNAGTGLSVWTSNEARILDNVIEDSGAHGVKVGESSSVDAHGNNIVGNDDGTLTHGLDAFESTVDATDNYWGCPDGPDDADCDDVEGTDNYSPWLSSPNPDAGA